MVHGGARSAAIRTPENFRAFVIPKPPLHFLSVVKEISGLESARKY